MPNKHYIVGHNFELQVKKFYEGNGYLVVRNGKSQIPDLVALKAREDILLIECKYNTSRLSKAERQKMREMAQQAGAVPILATRKKGQRIITIKTL